MKRGMLNSAKGKRAISLEDPPLTRPVQVANDVPPKSSPSSPSVTTSVPKDEETASTRNPPGQSPAPAANDAPLPPPSAQSAVRDEEEPTQDSAAHSVIIADDMAPLPAPPTQPSSTTAESVGSSVTNSVSSDKEVNKGNDASTTVEPEKTYRPEDCKEDQRILHHLGPDPACPGQTSWTLNQLIEDAPSDMLEYEPHELICTTQPAQLTNVARETNPDGWAECLITGLMKQQILQTPSFPQPLAQPARMKYRVGKETKSKAPATQPLPGLYAKSELSMGDLILSERPVLVVPAMMRVGEIFSQTLSTLSAHEQRDLVMNQWQKSLETVFGRLSEEDQAKFWELRDIRAKDGKKSINGIVKTNGFEIVGLADPGLEDKDGAYTGVCLVLSQMNHSCRPNVERYWDMASFSMQLRASRKIARDEELTVTFINPLEPYAVRQKQLSLFDIKCSCPTCKNPKIGDMRRKQFLKGIPTSDDFADWIRDVTLPSDHIIKRALVQITLLEDDGLENSTYYQDCLTQIMLCYVALGDAQKAMRWGKKLGIWEVCKFGPESGKDYGRMERYTKHQLWKLRVNAENSHKATAYAMKKTMGNKK